MNLCTCADWAPGVEKLNGPILLAQARTPLLAQTPEFQFIPWTYCPWCGSTLAPSLPEKASLEISDGSEGGAK